MQIEIGSVLRFPLQCPYREKMISNLKLENPGYKSAKAFSPYSLRSIDQFKYYYQDDIYNKQTIVPVGKKEELFAYCSICPHKCPVIDFRTTGQTVEAFQFKEKITPRPSQIRAIQDIQNTVAYTGNGLVVMPTGCHAKGTKVLMYDGTWREVENVNVGDVLMGPDSLPRSVLKLHRGKEQMYKIIPTKGKPFIVNENHILSLVKTTERGSGFREKQKSYETLINEHNVTNISVREYLCKSNHFKHLFKLYRPEVIHFNTTNVLPVEPYMLGLLLGDGSLQHTPKITTADSEVFEFIYNWSIENNLQVSVTRNKNRSSNYALCGTGSGRGVNHSNTLVDVLNRLNLRVRGDFKHIPHIYQTAPLECRLELLAGLMDSAGHLRIGGGFEYTTKSVKLAEDIKFVAQSCGLSVTLRLKTVNDKNYYRLSINGDVDQIPTRLPRKQATSRKQKKSHLRTGFIVKPVGVDDYYGFTVDGDNLYVMEDFFVTHNCGKTFLSFLVSQMSNKSTIFITHTIDLAEQTASSYEALTGVKPGFIGDGVYDINPVFTVAIIDTLYSRKNYEEISSIFGMALFDEVHLLPAESCIEVLNSLTIKYIVGFTATPRRGDGLTPVIYGCFGNIVTKVTIEEAQKEGSLVPLYAEVLPTDYQSPYSDEQVERKKSLLNAAIKEASLDLGRNKITASKTEELCDLGHSVLLVLQNVEQCQLMFELLKDKPSVRSEIFVGQIGKKKFSRKQRKAIVDRARSGETNVLITVQLAGMGLDVPRLTALIMDRKITDPTAVEQVVGRVVRACPSLGKIGAVLYDVYDQFVPFFVKQTNKRFQVYYKFRKFE